MTNTMTLFYIFLVRREKNPVFFSQLLWRQDTRIEGKNLVGKFIADVVLQVLSFFLQKMKERR